MKICLVTDTWFPIIGGGPQVTWNYAKKLAINHNCKVDIITRRFNQQDNFNLEKVTNLRIIKFGPPLAWNNIFARLLFTISSFFHLMFNNYDIIHAFPFISGLPVWFYGVLTKKPVVFSVFALSSQKNERLKLNVTQMLENFLTFGLSYKLLITDNTEIFKKHKEKNIKYLPNGVDVELFDKVKIKKDKFPRLLFVGRFHKQKGIPILLEATKQLVGKFPTLKLVLIGYGKEEINLRFIIKELQINKHVQIKPPKFGIDLIKEYKKSHVLILPSLYEGQGIVVLEAWAAKIPVIATEVGSLDHMIKNGKNGYLVKPNKPDELIHAIHKVITSGMRRRNLMGDNGFWLVKQKFTWQKVVREVYKEYLNIVNVS